LKYARRYAVSPAHFALAALILGFARLGPNIFNSLTDSETSRNHWRVWFSKRVAQVNAL